MEDDFVNPFPWEIFLQRQPWGGVIAVRIGFRDDKGRLHAVSALTMQTVPEGGMIPQAFKLQNDEAQALMDELWKCGIRPSEGTGSAGQLAATQYHLEDMRCLAFNIPAKGSKE